MAQYPNYLNQPYQPQNNYSQYGYQPMQMDRMAQLQQFQQSLQQPQMQMQTQSNFVTLGKMVDSIDIVKATDIPMDGNMYYFPKADGTEIYAKQWLQNGQTRILTFKPILNNEADNSSQSDLKVNLGAIEEFTEVLENKLDEFYKRITSTKTQNGKKKEVSADE